ncbi:25542_t:CDS:1 [Racocetra persica]|uniref:25542_t:CDS:1 n=1 Tax=Racocetra persica TaxID=160502 RepID=A0ACA9L4V4_9GLOM|nr:25542_t:CDS:1 [Racocetra persica]
MDKITINLPFETLTQVFQNLFEIYGCSVKNCIYVNKSWAIAALPILWRAPFTNTDNSIKLIETLLSNLPENKKIALTQNLSSKWSKCLSKNTTMYNYAEWIRELPFELIFNSIRWWLDSPIPQKKKKKLLHNKVYNTSNDHEQINKVQDVYSILIPFIFESSKGLYTLDLTFQPGQSRLLNLLEQIEISNESLRSITDLYCHSIIPKNFYGALKKVTRKLKRLHLNHPQQEEDVTDLAELIRHQKGLQSIRLNNSRTKISMLLQSFSSQAATLTTLRLHTILLMNKGLDALGTLVNLETLEIKRSRTSLFYAYDPPDPLWIMPHLKKLHLIEIRVWGDMSAIHSILKKTVPVLDELVISQFLSINNAIQLAINKRLPLRQEENSKMTITFTR